MIKCENSLYVLVWLLDLLKGDYYGYWANYGVFRVDGNC